MCDEQPSGRRSPSIPDHLPVAEVARLLSRSPAIVRRHCAGGKYHGARKEPGNGGEGWTIPVASLPMFARHQLIQEVKRKIADSTAIVPAENSSDARPYAPLWEAYERSGAVSKAKAQRALDAVESFSCLVDSGLSNAEAEKQIQSKFGIQRTTLFRYRKAVEAHPRIHWLPLLAPKYKGGRMPSDFTLAAYQYILSGYLSTSQPPLSSIINQARKEGQIRGWVIPSDDTIERLVAAEDRALMLLGRVGAKALESHYPAAERDYTRLALHEYWESDGRKADVFCRWPDGTTARPFIIVWREIRSRLVLSAKGYLNPSAEGVISSFGMAMERTGVAPDYAKIDNGTEYAAKSVTGGQDIRYRFKVIPGEQPGIMTLVGTKVMWSKPARGQDKPIESFWRYVADRCDKSPEFQGAYCGSSTVAKPEDFDRKMSVPLEEFSEKLAYVLDCFNKEHQHTGSGMNGRSPMEVYNELSESSMRDRVDSAHLRLCKMGRAVIKPSTKDATYTIKIPGYPAVRYYSATISGMPQDVLCRQHAVYYDLDSPGRSVSVYDGDTFLGEAHPIDTIHFREVGGERAAAHVKLKNKYMKGVKERFKAIKEAGKLTQLSDESQPALANASTPIDAVQIKGARRPVHFVTAATEAEETRLAELEQRASKKRAKRLPEWLNITDNKAA